MEKKIAISVRRLVEFVLRSGDIDLRMTGSDRMLEGAKAHRRIQKASPGDYRAEVTLAYTFEYRGFEITLSGRADGVIIKDGGVTVDEIKSTTLPLEEAEDDPMHWAQAKCYAFMLSRLEGYESVTVRLTYCSLEEDGLKQFSNTFSASELAGFIQELFDRYILWAEYEYERLQWRDEDIRAAAFPFAGYRAGQRALAAAVYHAVAGGNHLFAQAPTGIGKTISTLFPAIKALAEGKAQKIFYLTAKTTTRQAAQEAVLSLRLPGRGFKSVTLTAKDKICPHPGTACNPESCPLAKGYYDRVNGLLMEMLKNESLITRETVCAYAEKYGLCPFELSLDVSQWVDLIICDYNYVFDPTVYLRRFFQDASGEYVFLVDEAHNLVDRAREMYSAELSKSAFLKIKKAYRDKDRSVSAAAGKINRHFLDLQKTCLAPDTRFYAAKDEDDELYRLVAAFIRRAEKFLVFHQGEDELLELYFESLAFIKISGFFDERYVTLVKAEGREVSLRLFCLDPSFLLAAMLSHAKAAVFFSATLSPLNYFREILGGSPESRLLRLPSPFERDNLCLLVADGVSTRYAHRGASCGEVASLIRAMALSKKGNYIAFFPSYKYMNEVYKAFRALCPEIRTVLQSSGMGEDARGDFLARFEPGGESLVGFCVMGGIFSEGIDLKGERLIGTAIVGVGLPQISPELNLIQDYFRQKNGAGFEYAYMYPGMNKVLQAAGRVIRSESDRGVVLLIDDRFTRRDYLALFPEHWRHYRRVKNEAALRQALEAFWGGY